MYVEVCMYGGRLIMCCTEESNKIVMCLWDITNIIFLKKYIVLVIKKNSTKKQLHSFWFPYHLPNPPMPRAGPGLECKYIVINSQTRPLSYYYTTGEELIILEFNCT